MPVFAVAVAEDGIPSFPRQLPISPRSGPNPRVQAVVEMLADRRCQQVRCRRRPAREKRACDLPARSGLVFLAIESTVLVALGRGPIRREGSLSYGPAPPSLSEPAGSQRVRSLEGPYGTRNKRSSPTLHSQRELRQNLWIREEVRAACRHALYERGTEPRTHQRKFFPASL